MQLGFERKSSGRLVYYTIGSFERTGLVRHCFTTRLGGVSEGEAASLNLGFQRKDTKENVLNNYQIVADAIGVDVGKMVASNQVHGDTVRIVTQDDWGKGIVRESDIKAVDALICQEPNVPMVTYYADCVPVFFLDPRAKVAALAHSGWRSTVKKISAKVIDTMRGLGCRPEDVLVGVGPSIGQCHFEVDGDVAQQFEQRFVENRGSKFHVDLWGVIAGQLIAAGIQPENITLANLCTYCHHEEFYSHRADHGKTGSLAAVMQLI